LPAVDIDDELEQRLRIFCREEDGEERDEMDDIYDTKQGIDDEQMRDRE